MLAIPDRRTVFKIMAEASAVSNTSTSNSKIRTPEELLVKAAERWNTIHTRSVVRTVYKHTDNMACISILSLPAWPGGAVALTPVDTVPHILIPGMPAERYLEQPRAMSMYTAAEMVCSNPVHSVTGGHAALLKTVTLVTVVRAGVWRALGITPVGESTVTATAVRWSNRKESLVVRPASESSDANLWRHFLAMSPPCPAFLTDLVSVMPGLAPMLFLYGASLHLKNGDLLSAHFLEQAMDRYAHTILTDKSYTELSMSNLDTWELMGAAAVSGFSVSVIKHVIRDPLFVTSAQIYVSTGDTSGLVSRRSRIAENATTGLKSMSSLVSTRSETVAAHRASETDLTDVCSVADTEVSEADHVSSPSGPGMMDAYLERMHEASIDTEDDDTTIRTPMRPGDVSAIRDGARLAQALPNRAPSVVKDADPDETVIF